MAAVVVLLITGAWQAGIRGTAFISFVSYVGLFFLASWWLRLYAMKKLDTNWDISDRAKRVKSLVPFLGICAVFFGCMLLWGNAALVRFGMTLVIWILGFVLITLRTKISGHLGVLTLTLGFLIIWFGAIWLPGLLLLPVVGWSRLVLRRHTMTEVIGGILYSLIFHFLLLYAPRIWGFVFGM